MATFLNKTSYNEAIKRPDADLLHVSTQFNYETANGLRSVTADVVIPSGLSDADSIVKFEEASAPIITLYSGVL